jgi:hypothetical protein
VFPLPPDIVFFPSSPSFDLLATNHCDPSDSFCQLTYQASPLPRTWAVASLLHRCCITVASLWSHCGVTAESLWSRCGVTVESLSTVRSEGAGFCQCLSVSTCMRQGRMSQVQHKSLSCLVRDSFNATVFLPGSVPCFQKAIHSTSILKSVLCHDSYSNLTSPCFQNQFSVVACELTSAAVYRTCICASKRSVCPSDGLLWHNLHPISVPLRVTNCMLRGVALTGVHSAGITAASWPVAKPLKKKSRG